MIDLLHPKKLIPILLLLIIVIALPLSVSLVQQEQTTIQNAKSEKPVILEKPSSGNQAIQIYLIALEDDGKTGEKIGCGDSAVAVNRSIKRTAAPLQAAIEELLSLQTNILGESSLYNSLYGSQLSVQKISVSSRKAAIYLTGSVSLGGVCDNPRFEAQLTKTAKQFESINRVEIFINSKPLKEVLSLK